MSVMVSPGDSAPVSVQHLQFPHVEHLSAAGLDAAAAQSVCDEWNFLPSLNQCTLMRAVRSGMDLRMSSDVGLAQSPARSQKRAMLGGMS
jgi:hypothetical protein